MESWRISQLFVDEKIRQRTVKFARGGILRSLGTARCVAHFRLAPRKVLHSIRHFLTTSKATIHHILCLFCIGICLPLAAFCPRSHCESVKTDRGQLHRVAFPLCDKCAPLEDPALKSREVAGSGQNNGRTAKTTATPCTITTYKRDADGSVGLV